MMEAILALTLTALLVNPYRLIVVFVSQLITTFKSLGFE
jgi:hypothetical protein